MKPPRVRRPPPVAKAKSGWRQGLGGQAHRQGHGAEWVAAALLLVKGYQILGFRLKTVGAEIDILARQGRTLVVVEVKRRSTMEAALSAIDPQQLERLRLAGQALLRQRPSFTGLVLRIDMVALAPRRFPVHRCNL